MSTQFFTATNSNPEVTFPKLGLYDTDAPISFFEVLHQIDPLTNFNWVISIHDYKGDLIENGISFDEIYLDDDNQLAALFAGDTK